MRVRLSIWQIGILAFLFLIALVWHGKAYSDSTPVAPAHLSQTGIDAPESQPYSPQYPLWTDGAKKRRWIQLPAGTKIDATDPDRWKFPIGTKIWKEFSFNGKRVETRFIERATQDDWIYATYLWNADETDAVLAPEAGIPQYVTIAPGKKHDIPGVRDCKACHENHGPELLGFGALQLSTDRDPLAPHAEPLPPGAVTLQTLVERGLLAPSDPALVTNPPRIAAPTPTARAAMGYLHANCGQCHAPGTPTNMLGMFLRHELGAKTFAEEPAWATTVGVESYYQLPGLAPGTTLRINPSQPDVSSILYRMNSRNVARQMPPLGTHLVDDEGVALLRAWILELPPGARAQ